ncbi:hypothetical protein EDB80DRAFT_743554 [Ilyonectria destructans]|nr:hypothetical protein EDB80DRAFT_743554 [Ilyonectria destructans]
MALEIFSNPKFLSGLVESISSDDHRNITNGWKYEMDKVNWTFLCSHMQYLSNMLDCVAGVVDNLVLLDPRFRYIARSLGDQRSQIISFSDVAGQMLLGIQDDVHGAGRRESRKKIIPFDIFVPSDGYDWSNVHRDLYITYRSIRMATVMAIYELLETNSIQEATYEQLAIRLDKDNWTTARDEALVEVLTSLSQEFEAIPSRASPSQFGNPDSAVPHCANKNARHQPGNNHLRSPPYPGPPLGKERDQIRILELLPGTEDQQTECLISAVDLDLAEPYEALSYVWGNSAFKNKIELNGVEFSIQNSLHVALARLRNRSYRSIPSPDRSIYIDRHPQSISQSLT